MMLKPLFSFSTLAGMFLLLSSGSVMAEKVDVCNDFSGAARGLCNAYCGAMNCQANNDGDATTWSNADQTACDNVAANFADKSDNAQMPCEVPPKPACPCSDSYAAVADRLAITGVSYPATSTATHVSAEYDESGPGYDDTAGLAAWVGGCSAGVEVSETNTSISAYYPSLTTEESEACLAEAGALVAPYTN